MGRPKTPHPAGIGIEKDIVVALAEGVEEVAIRVRRHRYNIPPPSEPHRSRWERKNDLCADDVCAQINSGKWD